MNNYLQGLNDCGKGLAMIFKKGIRRYVFVPFIVNVTLFAGAIYLINQQMDVWIQRLLPQWLSWLEWLIWPLFALTLLLIVFYTFTLVANLIAAPFNSLLSASIEAKLTGSKPPVLIEESLWKTTARTLRSELRKSLYFVRWLVPLILLTLMPGLNIAAPFAWFLFAAWSFSLEYTDSPLGNRGLLFDDVRAHNRKHRLRALGLGTGVFVMTSIPVVNFIAMPVGVAAATFLTLGTTILEEPEVG